MQQLRFHLPQILHRRLVSLKADDDICHAILNTEGPAKSFLARVTTLAQKGPPDSYWREVMATAPMSMDLQGAADDQASR